MQPSTEEPRTTDEPLAGSGPPSRGSGSDLDTLERFVLGGPPPARATLERARLAAYAYGVLPEGHPGRSELRDAFVAASARHLGTKAALGRLLAGWAERGVEAMLLKGIYLAEFAYAHPAQRAFADVDLLVRPEQVHEALQVAAMRDWRVAWERRRSLYGDSHEEAVLLAPGTTVELHRFVIDCDARYDRVQRRITEAVWARSRRVRWQGANVRVPDPVDALLTGLVLARMWSGGDDLHLKPSDLLDMRAVADRFGVEVADLRTRAGELGCARTLELFLERCDPWARRLSLRPPTRSERRDAFARMAPERGNLRLERAAASARRLPGTLIDTLRYLPLVAGTALQVPPASAPLPDIGSLRQAGRPRGQARVLMAKERAVRGVKWAARVLAPWGDPCRIRSVALHRALGALGLSTHVEQGWEQHGNGLRWHAWLRVEGAVMRDLDDVESCRIEGRSPARDGVGAARAVFATPGTSAHGDVQ